MSKAHEAVKGLSYLSGGKWRVAAAGDLIEIDDEQVDDALKRGVIKAVAKKAPPITRKGTEE
jgi:hypothetical protein